MRLDVSDKFVRFLTIKSQNDWSTAEVLEIFKYRYGENYEKALVNFMMDSLQSYAPKIRKGRSDSQYANMWNSLCA